jgi:hypothetical protein
MNVPHGIQMATKGFLGVTIGTVSKGYLIRIVEVTPRTTGPGRHGFREDENKEQKVVKITVYAYGKKWETTHTVSTGIKIGIEDVEVSELDGDTIQITLRNLT